MKHISLKVSDVIKNILPDTLEKDLQDNEIICPTCKGLGVVKCEYPFGLKEKLTDNQYSNKINWYDNDALTFCPNCYNGIVSLCEYCGKPIQKGYINRCDCEQYKAKEAEEKRLKYQEIINKATEVKIEDVKTFLYDENTDEYYQDIDEFIDTICIDFDYVTEILWLCEKVEISIDADNIIEDACGVLHEDASDNCDYGSLQGVLDEWCEKQTGTTTFYPCYKEYVRVNKEWFKD